MSGVGVWADQIAQLFRISLTRSGLSSRERPRLSTASFRVPPSSSPQLDLAL